MSRLHGRGRNHLSGKIRSDPLKARLADILGEAIELSRATDFTNIDEEAGDCLASLLALHAECKLDPEQTLRACLEKINRRRGQYDALGHKLKVALLGGAFDPPTLGHIAVAKLVLDATNEFDEVWLTPCFKHMYNKQMSSAADRLTMCKIAAQGDGRIKTFDYEIKNQLAVDTPQGLSLRKSVCGTPATSKRWTTTCAWLSRPGAPLVERKLLPLT